MTDAEGELARDIIHLKQRLNQALSAEIEYQTGGVERDRLAALAELEAIQDDLDAILDDHRN